MCVTILFLNLVTHTHTFSPRDLKQVSASYCFSSYLRRNIQKHFVAVKMFLFQTLKPANQPQEPPQIPDSTFNPAPLTFLSLPQ